MGKGQKKCSKCGTITGPRALKCVNCGQDYVIKQKSKPIERIIPPEKIAGTQQTSFNLCFVPGKPSWQGNFCPVNWLGNSNDKVLEWLDIIRDYIFESCGNRTKYSRSAIIAFVEYFVPRYIQEENEDGIDIINNPEYNRVVQLIKENMPAYEREVILGY